MPRFTYKRPTDGRTVTLEGAAEPTEQELDQIFAELDAPEPARVESTPTEGPSLLGRIMTPVARVANVLGRPGAAVAAAAKEGVEGFQQGQDVPAMLKDMGRGVVDTLTPTGWGEFKRNDDFDKVLGQAGMEEGWTRAGLGFVGDVVLDPTFMGPGAKLMNKAVSGTVKGGVKGLDLATDAVGLAPVKKSIARRFEAEDFSHLVDQRAGAATEGLNYGEMKRLAASSGRAESEHAQKFAEDFFGKTATHGRVNPEDQTKLLYAIDEGRTTGDPRLDALIPEWKAKMDDLHAEMVKRRWIDPQQYQKDYVRYLTRSGRPADAVVGSSTSALPGASNARKIQSLKEAVTKHGATDDAQEVLAKTISQVGRAAKKEDFLKEVRLAFGDVKGRPGYREIRTDRINVSDNMKSLLKGTYVPEELADDLERAVVLWENPDELNEWWVNGNKILKSLMTTINPGHHAANAMGNIHNMYIGGMDMKSIATGMVESRRIAKAARENVNAMPTIGRYTPDELMQAARDFEILGTSSILGETNARGTFEKVANNKVFREARKFGTQRVEEPSRVAFFLDRIRKGDSPAKAALKTKDVLFDYAELTPWEKKWIRDSGIMPFYCVPTSYQALTRTGWKSHDELVEGEDIYTYNAHRDTMEWSPVLGVASFASPEHLLCMESKRTGQWWMTPGHRWAVKDYIDRRDIVPVEALNTGMRIVLNAEPVEDTVSLLTEDEARLLGWLLTDGYWRFRGTYCEAVIYQSPHKFLEEVQQAAGGVPRRPHPDTGVVCVPVAQSNLTPKLKAILQQGDFDSVPSQLSTSARQAMYDAMYKADGTVAEGRHSDFFAAIHEDVKATFATLAFLLGYCVTPSSRGVHIWCTQTKKTTTFTYQLRPTITDMVWCPSTQNETWVMRTPEGHIVVTGNTWMRKNIPLQLSAIRDNASAVEKVGDLQQVPWNAEQTETDQSIIPEWTQESGYVPSPLAGPDGMPVYQRLNLPMNDLNKFAGLQGLGDMLGPAPKTVIEAITGRRINGAPIQRPTGLAPASPLASILGLGLNPLLPDSMEGYITPKDTPMGPMQHDTLAWAMGLMPTGVYGSTAKMAAGESVRNPQMDPYATTLMRILSLSPDVLSPEDQQFAAQDKIKTYKRQLMRKVLMEK